MQNIHIPSLEERMEFSSAAQTITVIARQITEWEKTCPEGKHPVVNMRTPDGRSMDIERVRPEGFNVFIAEGYIEGLRCMIAAHLSTLMLFCSFEEDRGKSRAGFTAVLPERAALTPQPKPKRKRKPSGSK